MSHISRIRILESLRGALEPLPAALAMWEGGSAARAQVDEWSDIDVQVIASEEGVPDVFAAAEVALESVAPIEQRWSVPEPAWHGQSQRFYRLLGASPFLLVDLAVGRKSNPVRFLEPEQHGHPVLHFDKEAILRIPPFDAEAFRDKMRSELASLRAAFPLFQCFVEKELRRGNLLDAMNFYLGQTLRPLVTVLGMLYRPLRYNFGLRYLRQDLPPELLRELEELHLVRDAQDLGLKQKKAQSLFECLNERLDVDNIPLAELSVRARTH